MKSSSWKDPGRCYVAAFEAENMSSCAEGRKIGDFAHDARFAFCGISIVRSDFRVRSSLANVFK